MSVPPVGEPELRSATPGEATYRGDCKPRFRQIATFASNVSRPGGEIL
jgi:hypothetical protein